MFLDTMTADINELELMLLPGQGESGEKPVYATPEEAQRAFQRSNTPDFAQFRNAHTESWTELVSGENFAEYIASLVPQVVLLPRGDFQLPIVCSYLMLASALCSNVPILFSHGAPGSGKSALAHLACLIHDKRPIGANSTPTSLRNAIMAARFGEPVDGEYYQREQHAILAWEDVNPTELRRYEFALFNLLKLGIDRKATIQIASDKGKNLQFYPFSPKYISSIHPVYSEYDYRELVRRVIVIQHKKFDNWLNDDRSNAYANITPHDLIDLESYDWDGFSECFQDYWKDLDKLNDWTEAQKALSKVKKNGIDRPLWKISRDLLATGLVCEYWKNELEAVEHIREYWHWHRENIESQSSALQKNLLRFIESECSQIKTQNAIAKQCGQSHLIQELQVKPDKLQEYVKMAMAKGEVEPGTPLRAVNEAMLSLGWKLTVNSQGQTMWMQSAQ